MERLDDAVSCGLDGVSVSRSGVILQGGKPQKLTASVNGYLVFRHRKTGAVVYAHRVIASALVPRLPGGGDCVNHLDGDKTNNDASNLEWTTSKGNNMHAWSTGLCKRRMSEEDVSAAASMYDSGVSMSEIGRRFKMSRATVARILRAETYKHLERDKRQTSIRSGELHWRSSVSVAMVKRIKFMRGMAMTYRDIVSITGATYPTVAQICSGATWSHVVNTPTCNQNKE